MTSYEYSYALEDALGTGFFSGILSSIPSFAISIATYVLTALALYTIAKRRGINKPWLAWIPVVDVWLLGSISDQYRYVVKGENKSKRKALLTLNIIMAAMGVVMVIALIAMVVKAIGGVVYSVSEEEMLEQIMGPVLSILGLCVPLIGVSIAYTIIYYMALYDVYTSCEPSNNVLFLVLSILIGVTQPFFLFFSRNKDKGMPPRRSEPTYIPPVESNWQQPVQEPWENENKDYL